MHRNVLAPDSTLVAMLITFAGAFWASPSRPAFGAILDEFDTFSFDQVGAPDYVPGRLRFPLEYATDPSRLRPMVVYLHGSGDSGEDNARQVENDEMRFLVSATQSRDAFVYAPQTDVGWGNSTFNDTIMSMIDRAIANYRVDPARIYLTGYSMGGGGVWDFLNRHSERFAASVPVAGVYPRSLSQFNTPLVAHEPIWIFHGRDDSIVPHTISRDMLNRLLTAIGEPLPNYPTSARFTYLNPNYPIRYSEFPGIGHAPIDIVGTAYRNAMFNWMFSHVSVPEPTCFHWSIVGMIAWSRRRIAGGW